MATAPFKGAKTAPKVHSSTMDTLLLSVDQVNNWKTPPFQRPIRVNNKVMALAEEMKQTQTIVGMITLGHLAKDNADYIVDGQHRIEAFRISGLGEVIADVRVINFDSMSDMADEFVNLNTALVKMRPDDLLRGVTPSLPVIKHLMEMCPFIGYDNIRRRDTSGPVISLSQVLRCWSTSEGDTPSTTQRVGIAQTAQMLDSDSAGKLMGFLELALTAWGRDPEYYRLWGNLNLALCMWLYRRVVLAKSQGKGAGQSRAVNLTREEFKQCLMALSARSNYLDWLQGRLLNDRDRGPGLSRIKSIFMNRLAETRDGPIRLPQPPWQTKLNVRDMRI